jgi:hypothetical protein
MTHHEHSPINFYYWLLAFLLGGLIWGVVIGAIFKYLPPIIARLMR